MRGRGSGAVRICFSEESKLCSFLQTSAEKDILILKGEEVLLRLYSINHTDVKGTPMKWMEKTLFLPVKQQQRQPLSFPYLYQFAKDRKPQPAPLRAALHQLMNYFLALTSAEEASSLMFQFWCGGCLVYRGILLAASQLLFTTFALQRHATDVLTALYSQTTSVPRSSSSAVSGSHQRRRETLPAPAWSYPQCHQGASIPFLYDPAVRTEMRFGRIQSLRSIFRGRAGLAGW